MHDVRLTAPRDLGAGPRPALLQRSDEDFIGSTLDDLRSATGRTALRALRAQAVDAQGTRKLFQPIQRQFHLALLEAWCDTPGAPRIDPRRVEQAGLVVRRIAADGRREGWMRSQGRVRGWVPLARTGGEEADPAPGPRLQRRLTGVADIDRQLSAQALAQPDNRLEEDVVPLFLAPPDVCAAAAQTLYYGLVPTISGELGEAAPAATAPGGTAFDARSTAFVEHLVGPLQGLAQGFPFAGAEVVAGWFDASEMPGASAPEGVSPAQFQDLADPNSANAAKMREFIRLLRQLAGEFNAFAGGPAVQPLRSALAAVRLPLVLRDGEPVARTVAADTFLAAAADRLLMKRQAGGPLEMPERWPALDAAATRALHDALHAALQAQTARLVAQGARFDEPGARYVARAFVRLRPQGPCPAHVVWSAETEPWVIAPWFEAGGDRPPLQIPLPDATDRSMLAQLTPNVAFVVPPSLQNLLSGKAKDLLEGKGKTTGPGLAWICGFNIPVITICAFIVLNIFLTLLHLVFGWLFFIKICIPFPKVGNKAPGGPPFP